MKSITFKKLIGGSLATVMAVSISFPLQVSASTASPQDQTSLRYGHILHYFQTYYMNTAPTIVNNNVSMVYKPVPTVAPQKSTTVTTTTPTTTTPVTKSPVATTSTNTTTATNTATATNNATSKLSYTQQVVALVNKERLASGLPTVTGLDSLNKVAAAKATDMRTNQYFSHTSPTYGSPFEMMTAFGITYKAAGENIAMGQRTPEEVMTAWMNSPGHRKNILSKDFNYIGVGFDNNYWVQQFIGK